MKYKYFPKRLLDELQRSVRKKIQSNNEFQLTEREKSSTKEFLQDTVVHIENICDSEGSLMAALDFYMQIGAAIPESTVKYVKNSSRSNGMIQRLCAYPRVIKRPVITFRRSGSQSDSNDCMSVFTSVYMDRGTKRKIIYSDSFNNLMRNIQAWVDDDSTCFIRNDQEYDLVVDGCLVATINQGKNISVLCTQDVDDFIDREFGKPLDTKLTIRTEVLRGKCSFYWICDESHSGSSSLFLPSQTSLRVDIVRDEIKVIATQAIQQVKHTQSLTSDINLTIELDGVLVAEFNKKSCSLQFVSNLADVVLGAVGIEERPDIDFVAGKIAKKKKWGMFKRIFNFLHK
ncbi:hypothetical protein [Photobacterium damselae]|uniref:hypothetical protein n=1 Tax=Photobacterium damselae TaxID=38293 RepID=UPI004067CF9B